MPFRAAIATDCLLFPIKNNLRATSTEEEPLIPEYDYIEISNTLNELDEKICRLKHAINISNVNSEIDVFGKKYSVDVLLVKMAQVNKKKAKLDRMRKQLPKSRVEEGFYSARKSFIEYRYVNYDLEKVKKDYEEVSKLLFEMQMKLDEHNQNVLFDLEID